MDINFNEIKAAFWGDTPIEKIYWEDQKIWSEGRWRVLDVKSPLPWAGFSNDIIYGEKIEAAYGGDIVGKKLKITINFPYRRTYEITVAPKDSQGRFTIKEGKDKTMNEFNWDIIEIWED